MEKLGLISVVIPAYNRPEMLLRAVRSVLTQAGPAFELLVLDDGSESDLEQVRALCEAAGQRFLKLEHRGVAATRNRGLAEAKGEWICLLDSDDAWLPGKLQAQVGFHLANPNVALSQMHERWYRKGKRVNKKKSHIQPTGDVFSECLSLCCISSSSVMFQREVWDIAGPYDESMPVCEDYDFWLRVSSRFKLGLVEHELVEKFGGHADQLSKSVPALDRFRLYAILKLLTNFELTPEQRAQAFTYALEKAKILYLGANKRGLASASTYTGLCESLKNPELLSQSDLNSLLCVVTNLLGKAIGKDD